MVFRALLPVVAASLVLLSACGGDDDDPTPTPAPPEATATVPAATPTVEQPTGTPGGFTGSTDPVEAPPPAGLGQATLVNVRSAAQPGFDRIVFEFSGSQVPGCSVKYVEQAIACGSGQDLTEFIGEGAKPAGLLLVRMEPAVSHNEAGEATAVRALRPGLTSIVNAFRTCDFEGEVTYGIAISDEHPFKVSTLPDPPRLVIDIAQ